MRFVVGLHSFANVLERLYIRHERKWKMLLDFTGFLCKAPQNSNRNLVYSLLEYKNLRTIRKDEPLLSSP